MTKETKLLIKVLEWLEEGVNTPPIGLRGAIKEALAQPVQEPVLQEIEQYRMQMAAISAAATGYLQDRDGINPDYATVALHDVVKLYAKYDELYKAKDQTPPLPVRPESCQICAEIHAVLDADESKIIRNAQEGYPEGRTPRELTLLERVKALCTYAADWKRWCIEAQALEQPPLPVQPEQEPMTFDAFLNSKDFYELMQTYRHFQIDAFKQFEAVKDALRAIHNTGVNK